MSNSHSVGYGASSYSSESTAHAALLDANFYIKDGELGAFLENAGNTLTGGERNAAIVSFFKSYEHRLPLNGIARLISSLTIAGPVPTDRPLVRHVEKEHAVNAIVEGVLRSRYHQLKEYELLYLFQLVENPRRRESLRRVFPSKVI